jgi:hypothetical protein
MRVACSRDHSSGFFKAFHSSRSAIFLANCASKLETPVAVGTTDTPAGGGGPCAGRSSTSLAFSLSTQEEGLYLACTSPPITLSETQPHVVQEDNTSGHQICDCFQINEVDWVGNRFPLGLQHTKCPLLNVLTCTFLPLCEPLPLFCQDWCFVSPLTNLAYFG